MKNFLSLVFLLLFFIALPVWLGIFLMPKAAGPGAAPEQQGIVFQQASYNNLINWNSDHHGQALVAFHKSCDAILRRGASLPMPDATIAGVNGDWHDICRAAKSIDTKNALAATRFFESHFTPLSVSYNGKDTGTFTGYYEPLLKGSYTKSARYNVPLYKKPEDMIKIDLGAFRDEYEGVSLRGTLEGGQLVPYADRTEIAGGALGGKDLELLWVDSEVDAFFLQIQGSGRVELDDGRVIGVGYADKNGHPYRAIGRKLIAEGELTRETTSLQTIRAWLAENPDRVNWLLDYNPSFVFFRPIESASGPYGSAGVTLTAERSLAVDRLHLPLHAPVWVEASHPDELDSNIHEVPFQKLMIAQDTGGAIKGAVRGDVFWGHGSKPNEIAGRMNNQGRLFLLLPNALAARALGQ